MEGPSAVSVMSPDSKALVQAEQDLKKSKAKGRMLQLQHEIHESEADTTYLHAGVTLVRNGLLVVSLRVFPLRFGIPILSI